jgi:hypothetical protein
VVAFGLCVLQQFELRLWIGPVGIRRARAVANDLGALDGAAAAGRGRGRVVCVEAPVHGVRWVEREPHQSLLVAVALDPVGDVEERLGLGCVQLVRKHPDPAVLLDHEDPVSAIGGERQEHRAIEDQRGKGAHQLEVAELRGYGLLGESVARELRRGERTLLRRDAPRQQRERQREQEAGKFKTQYGRNSARSGPIAVYTHACRGAG